MANLIYILVIDVPLIYIQSTFFAFSYFFLFYEFHIQIWFILHFLLFFISSIISSASSSPKSSFSPSFSFSSPFRHFTSSSPSLLLVSCGRLSPLRPPTFLLVFPKQHPRKASDQATKTASSFLNLRKGIASEESFPSVNYERGNWQMADDPSLDSLSPGFLRRPVFATPISGLAVSFFLSQRNVIVEENVDQKGKFQFCKNIVLIIFST